MRLTELVVSGFRGFAEEVTIDLDADVVIVSGTNGTGKTSLFDAIQWLLIGDVPRLTALDISKSEAGTNIANRYVTTPPYVAALLNDGEHEWRVSRRGVGAESQISVSGGGFEETGDRARVWVTELLGHHSDSARMFTRALMLQQDDVKEFLCADTKDRYRFLSELVGLEDLQRLDEQARSEARRLNEAARAQIDALEKSEAKLEADRLQEKESSELMDRQAAHETDLLRQAAQRVNEIVGSEDDDPREIQRLGYELAARVRRLLSEFGADDQTPRAGSEAAGAEAEDPGAIEVQAEDLARAKAELAKSEEGLAGARDAELRAEFAANEALSRQNRRQQFASLALEFLGDCCPVCEQPYDREHAVSHLRELAADSETVADARATLNKTQRDALAAAGEVSKHQAEVTRLELLGVRQATEREGRRQASVRASAALEEAATALQVPASRAEVEASVSALEQSLDELASVIQARTSQESASARLVALKASIDEQGTRLESLRAEALRLRDASALADSSAKWIGEHVTTTTTELVRGIVPLVNQLYTRLDVHPTFRRFDFRSDRRYAAGHVRPWVFDDEVGTDGNPAQLLSSAQLNALATCLFLALNLRHSPRLACALLDDPVQNMDDINVLSLVDTLRGIRSRRQIILSTHQEEFASLLWRKLRPLKDTQRTLYISLENWSPRGPEVEIRRRVVATGYPLREVVAA